MSETIPDAIFAEARAAFERVQADAYIMGGDIDNAYIEWHGGAVHIIAQAILAAEKRGMERAARLADEIAAESYSFDDYGKGYVAAAYSIASAIRKGAS